MSAAAVLTFQSISSTICLLLSWPVNLLLGWLIIYRTNSLMRVWSQILLQSVFIDLLLTLLLFLLQPMTIIMEDKTIYTLLNSPVAHFSPSGNLVLQSIAIFCNEFAKYTIAVQFVYRWLVICRNCQLSISKYALLLAVPASMALIDVTLINVEMAMEGNCDIHCSSCPADRAVICGWPMDSLVSRALSLAIFSFTLLTYSTVIIINVLIWRKSRQNLMPGQQQSQEISRQVGQALLVQALLPLAFTLVPTLLLLAGITVLGGDQQREEWLMVPFYQYWAGLFNPMATILIVSQYRNI